MQAGYAGGLFQQLPPGGRLGADDIANPTLADQRRRACAGGGVGKQKLDIPGSHFLAVDPVDRAFFALDAAADVQFIRIVESGGSGAGRIIEIEHNLGDIARRAVGGAAEDDIFHLAATHLFGGGFAHHPA